MRFPNKARTRRQNDQEELGPMYPDWKLLALVKLLITLKTYNICLLP